MTVTSSHIDIDVLIPVFRPNPEWFRAAISSITRQTYGGWRIVLSLDGSDVETLQAKSIAEEEVNIPSKLIVVHCKRSNITDTLNSGLEACTSEFVARLDCDDICVPNRLQLQRETLLTRKDVVACGMQLQSIDKNGHSSCRIHWYPTAYLSTLLVGSLINTPIAHPVLMVKTEVIKKIGGYRDRQCMEDYDLQSRLANKGLILNRRETGLLYRQHYNQHSSRIRPKRLDLLHARLSFLRALQRINIAWTILILVPVALWIIGPKAEYGIRRMLLVRSKLLAGRHLKHN